MVWNDGRRRGRYPILVLGVFAASAVLCFGQAAASAAGGTPAPSGSGAAQPPPPLSPDAVVLYDQYNSASNVGTSSQNFEAALDMFDDFLADDFVVPSGQFWSVTTVDVAGVYFNGPGPAASVNVVFYTNSGTNLPGTTLASRTNQAFSSGPTFSILLSSPVGLAAGTYWVSVQANQNFTPNGQWGWSDRSVQANSGAAWQNPGGGFAVCPTWGRRGVCIPSTANEPDQVFRLTGTTATTAVKVASFAARSTAAGVRVVWRTASEVDTLGFNVYRQHKGKLVRLNAALLPSVFGGTTRGHSYSWLDRNARSGTARYRLQAVSLDGTRRWIGSTASG